MNKKQMKYSEKILKIMYSFYSMMYLGVDLLIRTVLYYMRQGSINYFIRSLRTGY